MHVTTSRLGALVALPRVFPDARGWFFESWNARTHRGLAPDVAWVQDNVSRSSRGVLRGLHFQNPRPQAKLITCLDGAIFDVIVDLRASSATFGQWESFELSGETLRQLYVPVGFAHGFQVVSEHALVTYKCSDHWSPENEKGVVWDDPDLAIPWPVPDRIDVSEKDLRHPRLRELPRDALFG